MRYTSVVIAVTSLLISLGAAHAEGSVTADSKMSLYTFDKDKDGASVCYEDCAVNWPPYLGQAGEEASMGEGWSLVPRQDKSLQWAYQGKPLYMFKGDTKAGDVSGDGKGGVWHLLKP